jgi:ABC-type nitrate/sulfonate/bicarbonate transport system permease component
MYVSLVTIAILGYGGDRLVRFSQSKLLAWQQPSHA